MKLFFSDLLTVVAILAAFSFITALIASLSWGLYRKRNRKDEIAVAERFEREWSGDPRDELLSWYKVRNQVMGDQDISPRVRQNLVNIITRNIRHCRERNKSFRIISDLNGKKTIISNEN